jgi:hypothetical protein
MVTTEDTQPKHLIVSGPFDYPPQSLQIQLQKVFFLTWGKAPNPTRLSGGPASKCSNGKIYNEETKLNPYCELRKEGFESSKYIVSFTTHGN